MVKMSLSNTHMSSSQQQEGQHSNNIELYICMQGSGSTYTSSTVQNQLDVGGRMLALCIRSSASLHVCHQGVHWRLVNLQQPRPVDWMELLSVFRLHQYHRGDAVQDGWWLNNTTDGCCAALYVRGNNAVGCLINGFAKVQLKIVRGSHRHRVSGGIALLRRGLSRSCISTVQVASEIFDVSIELSSWSLPEVRFW